jgi:hypothetical protein
MNNDILYEVVKYLESPSMSTKIASAQTSEVNVRRMLRYSRERVEKKLSMRPPLKHLRLNNIYRDMDYRINFEEIHASLEDMFRRRGAPPRNKVAPSLARIVRKMEFEFKKVILRRSYES